MLHYTINLLFSFQLKMKAVAVFLIFAVFLATSYGIGMRPNIFASQTTNQNHADVFKVLGDYFHRLSDMHAEDAVDMYGRPIGR
jgi:hypothetical protein